MTETTTTYEVKIGITDSPRELVFTTTEEPADVKQLVETALLESFTLTPFTDNKGRLYLVPPLKIAWIEVGEVQAAAPKSPLGFPRIVPALGEKETRC